MALLGAGVTATYSGVTYFKWHQTPDMDFLKKHRASLGALANLIIPRTETPGALDAQVENTIIHFIENCTTRVEQNTFINGLKEVLRYAQNKMGGLPETLGHDKQIKVLNQFVETGQKRNHLFFKAKRKLIGRSFYEILNEYVIIAYCTSEVGATQGLAFDYIPGSYNGCIQKSPGQKAWATK